MYVCTSVTLRNANYVCTACTSSHISGGGVLGSKLGPIVGQYSKSLHLSISVLSEVSENHSTEAMDSLRLHTTVTRHCTFTFGDTLRILLGTRASGVLVITLPLMLAIIYITYMRTYYTFHLNLHDEKSSTFLSLSGHSPCSLRYCSFCACARQCAHARGINCVYITLVIMRIVGHD